MKALFYLVVLAVLIVCFTGWVKNLIKLSECDFEPPYKAEVIRTVGIIPIVGAFTGYMTIEDGQKQ